MLRLGACLVLLTGGLVPALSAQPLDAFREYVTIGDSLPALRGAAPNRIAAFAYRSGRWTPVPLQIDEREWLDIGFSYDGRDGIRCTPTPDKLCGLYRGFFQTLEYTDPDTWVGADSNPAFDGDDELVVMRRFAADTAAADLHPPGADPATRTAFVFDSLGTLYLYVVPSGPVPRSGETLVSYEFNLLNGPFKENYDFQGIERGWGPDVVTGEATGANPENSVVTTPYYRLHFADRWVLNELQLAPGNRQYAADLLDRYKVQIEPDYCARTEYSASGARGTLVAMIDGPVRGIRVVRGFNSGPLTTRTFTFYERHAVARTDLRVHSLPSVIDFFDYSAAADGMRFFDADNFDGVPIGTDRAEARTSDRALNTTHWQMVSGAPGALVFALRTVTDWNGSAVSFWDQGDRDLQCTGDAVARGASGLFINQRLPNTDPNPARSEGRAPAHLTFWRAVYFDTDARTAQEGRALAAVLLDGTSLSDPPPPTDGPRSETRSPVYIRSLYPNPGSVAERAYVRLQVATPTRFEIAVLDALGREVLTQTVDATGAGPLDVPLPLTTVASGVYVVQVTDGRGTTDRATLVRVR